MVFQRVITEFPPNIGVDVTGLNGDSLDQQQMFVRCNFAVPSGAAQGLRRVDPRDAPCASWPRTASTRCVR